MAANSMNTTEKIESNLWEAASSCRSRIQIDAGCDGYYSLNQAALAPRNF